MIDDTTEGLHRFDVEGGTGKLGVATTTESGRGRLVEVHSTLPESAIATEGTERVTTPAYRHEVEDREETAGMVFAADADSAREAAEPGDSLVVPRMAYDPTLAANHRVLPVDPGERYKFSLSSRGVTVTPQEQDESRSRGR